MTRICRGKLTDSMRAGALISACVAFVAMTSGLLLTIHLLTVDHAGHHDSHECSICQQLLVSPQKVTLVPSIAFAHGICDLPADVPEFSEHAEARYPQISRPRGPPC